MKQYKKVLLSIILIITIFLPSKVSAEDYIVSSANLTISFPYEWYVFTRDNIKDNEFLKDFELTYEESLEFMEENSIYIEGYYGDLAFYLTILNDENNKVNNLSNYTDAEVLSLSKLIAGQLNVDEYDTYFGKYKYANIEYFDTNSKYYINEFYTIINNQQYTFTIQKLEEFDETDLKEIKSIIDSIEFKILNKYKTEDKELSNMGALLVLAVIGGVVLSFAFVIINVVNKIKKKRM